MKSQLSNSLIALLPKKIKSPLGKDCKCHAYGEYECGCGADWTDNNRYNQAIDDMAEILSKVELDEGKILDVIKLQAKIGNNFEGTAKVLASQARMKEANG